MGDSAWKPRFSVRARALREVVAMSEVSSEKVCERVHAALERLSSFDGPTGSVPSDGLYFFYEEGERSGHGAEPRIVRVGNHPRAEKGLRRRLRQHYSGNKSGSVFRKALGGALLRREDPAHPCLQPGPGRGHWEKQKGAHCERCRPLEGEVSKVLRSCFGFRAVRVLNREERNRMELGLVAVLARCSLCRPSAEWLGRFAYSPAIRSSGLWNVQFTDGEALDLSEIGRFEELVCQTAEGEGGE